MIIKMDAKAYGVIRKAKDSSVIPDDQWVVFNVKDNAFAKAIHDYPRHCEHQGADQAQLYEVDQLIARMTAWRAANIKLCKVPDADNELVIDVTASPLNTPTPRRLKKAGNQP